MKAKYTEKDQNNAAVFLTVFLIIDFMNFIIGETLGIGGMIINIGLLGIVLMLEYKTFFKIQLPATVIVFIIAVTIYYVLTRQLSSSTLFGRNFIFSFCVASILGMYKCDTEKLLKYLSLATLLILPFYNSIFVEMNSTKYNTSVSMGLSYSMLPILLGSVFHFAFYRKKAKAWQYLIYAISAVLLVNLMLKGTRGILLSVVVALLLFYIKNGGQKNGVSGFKVMIAVMVVIVTATFFYDILGWVKDVLDDLGIDAHFLNKINRLREEGDVTNGRNTIFKFTIEEIMKSPFFGHGLSTIYVNSGYSIIYSHNFILQLLYDGGLLLTIPVLLIIGKAIYCAFAGEDKNEAIFTLFLIAVCLPKAAFSGDIWRNNILWLFVMHSLKFYTVKRKIKKIKNFEEDSDDVKEPQEDKGAEDVI